MKHIIIVNPVAGKKRNPIYANRIYKLLKKNKIEAEIITSTFAGEITNIVKEKASKEKCRFYSLGGDGTLNEIINGIVFTDSEVIVIPSGTGNDFSRNINKYKSMRKIVKESINLKSKKCDVLKVNNSKYCINILGAGFDSLVGTNLNRFRNIPLISGSMKYTLAILYTLMQNKNYKFKIRIDDKFIKKGMYTLVAIANGKYYGGGICPCPKADIYDNKLDVCMILGTSIIEKLVLLPTYKKGEHEKLKQIEFKKGSKITIVSTRKFPANIDGEVFFTNKLKCEVIKEAINVVVTCDK